MGEEELVSVPDAKFTKGEFQVGMPVSPLPHPIPGQNSWVLLAAWWGEAVCLPPRWVDCGSKQRDS